MGEWLWLWLFMAGFIPLAALYARAKRNGSVSHEVAAIFVVLTLALWTASFVASLVR